MPIGLDIPQGANHPVGPGAPITFELDHAQTPGDGIFYRVTIALLTSLAQPFWQEDFLFTSTFQYAHIGMGTFVLPARSVFYPVDGEGISFGIQLFVAGVVTDTGPSGVGMIWAPTTYIGELLRRQTSVLPGIHTIDDVWNSVNRIFGA